MTRSIPRRLSAALASAALVAAVTVAIALLEPRFPPLGLGVLYLLAVVPIALAYGLAAAAAVSVASMAVFNYLFLPPRYSLNPGSSQRWSVLVAFLLSSLVVSELAARSRREAQRSARLADEQAALRRLAALVVRGVPPPELFAAVVDEVERVLPVAIVAMARYESDATMTVLATSSAVADRFPVGGRWPVAGENVSTIVARTGRPGRIDSFAGGSERLTAAIREQGLHSSVGTPIHVEARLWGVMTVSSKSDHLLPADTEARLDSFTELVATAIANTEARVQLRRLAEEQAALRRVATLVARGIPQSELFAAVTEEAGRLLGADLAGMIRYEGEEMVVPVAAWAAVGEHPPLPERWPMQEGDPASLVAQSRRAGRIEDWDRVPGRMAAFIRDIGIKSSIGSPIVVDGHLWGALAIHSKRSERLPADSESRVENFTDLVATAISNVHARAEVERLADEQAALRRVATLVARELPAAEVFAGVAEEALGVLGVEIARLYRYEADGTATVVADAGVRETRIGVGTRVAIEGRNVSALVHRNGRPARVDDDAAGTLGVRGRALGVRSAVGTPIVVGDRLWGVFVVESRQPAPLPASTEARLASFTELVATAIANAEARMEVAASRARIVAATDQERRRVVRDLHDGAQQRLVLTVITLKQARGAVLSGEESAPALVTEALDHAEQATVELRELAHGILPGALTHGGLRAAVEALVSRMPVPVENRVSVGRLPPALEATAYFVVAEALTNVAKHARAERAEVTARIEHGTLAVHVRDDGVGGARSDGNGLLGLADRLAALDGTLRVHSSADRGTLVAAVIPLPD